MSNRFGVRLGPRGALQGRLIAQLICCVSLGGGSCASTPGAGAPDIAIAEAAATGDRYPAPRVTFPGGVAGVPDQVYATTPGYRPLTLDLYLPPSSLAPRGGYPLVLFIHGGAWQGGDARHAGAIEDFPSFLAHVAAQGYVVASINYRLSGEATFPAPVMDAKIALRWLRSRADLGLDPNRAVAWGVSAGGQIAGLLALACDAAELDPEANGALSAAGAQNLAGVSDCVQGLVLWYAPSEFTQGAGVQTPQSRTPEARYFGCSLPTCSAEVLRLASPISFVDAGDPPVLLIHGRADEVVPFWHADKLEQGLLGAGARAQLVAVDNVGHSFVGRSRAETRSATLLALDRTQSFIAEILAP